MILLSRPCPAQVLANPFLDDSQVQIVNLTMAPSDWASLQQNYLLDTYYPATFTWNGISESIGIRSHGGGSRSPIKPNLDVNFAHYDETQTFLGLPFVVLKANNEDASNMAEWISMKLYRMMGLPAPREAPAQVFLNGQILGFYYIVEHEDATFLQRNFGESGGYFYEWQAIGDNYDFGNLGTNPTLYAPYLELKSNQTAPDLQTFTNLVQVINQPSSSAFTDADFVQALSQYLDPIQFLTYGAIEQVLGGADSLIGGLEGMNNFYLYQFQGTTDYYFIAWDKDLDFSSATRDILDGISNGPNINLLAQRLYGIPQYQQVYLNAVMNAVTLMGGTGGWADSEITREYGVINVAASDDPNKQCFNAGVLYSCGIAAFESQVQWLHAFLSTRSTFVQSQAASDGYQPIAGGPQITAVSTNGGIGQLSPGAVAVVNGAGLAPAGQAYGLPLPRILQNETTFLAAEGVRAPLLMASDGSIQFQLPPDIPVGTVSIAASNNGALSNTFEVSVQASTPLITGVMHADGSNVTLSDPPIPGEVLSVYAAGLGAVTVNLPIGAGAPADPSALTAAAPQMALLLKPALHPQRDPLDKSTAKGMLLGNFATTISSSGLVPGQLALYLVNATVPNNLPSGTSYAGCTLTIHGQSASWRFPSD
jgi:uncharacterized protein (TIGR03437 family)